MTQSVRLWIMDAGTRGLRILVIFIIALILVRVLKAITKRMVQVAKSPTRAAQMREQQTHTMAGVVYSVGVTIILAVAILMRPPQRWPAWRSVLARKIW
jgi:hypothetical protein